MRLLKPLERYGQADYVTMLYNPLFDLSLQLHHKLDGSSLDEPFFPALPRVWMP